MKITTIKRFVSCCRAFTLFALLAGLPLAAQQNMGRLRVDATPTRAGIFVDGEYIGPARNHGTVRRYDLAPGAYTLTLRDSGYEDLTVTVTIEAGETTEINPSMEPLDLAEPPFGTLRIKSPDKFAAAYVNGRFMGHADEFNNFAQGLLLNPGQYEVEIAPRTGTAARATVTIEANETTIVGQDAFDRAGTYAGGFIGSGRTDNRIVDIEGFANWGNPGSVSEYDTAGLVGGVLIGKKFDVGGARLRTEIDGTFGDLMAMTNQLDPQGLDETAVSEFRWIATGRGGRRKGHRRLDGLRNRRSGACGGRQLCHGHRFRPKHKSAGGLRRFVSRKLNQNRLGRRCRFRNAAGRRLDTAIRGLVPGFRAEDPLRERIGQQFVRPGKPSKTLPLRRSKHAGHRAPGDHSRVRRAIGNRCPPRTALRFQRLPAGCGTRRG